MVESTLELPKGDYLLYEMYVTDGAKVTVAAGTTLLATEDAYLYVEGELCLAGTEEEKIEVTPCMDSRTQMWKGVSVAEGAIFEAYYTKIKNAAGPEYLLTNNRITDDTPGGVNIYGHAVFEYCDVVSEVYLDYQVVMVVNETGTLVFSNSEIMCGTVGMIVKSVMGAVIIENSGFNVSYEAVYVKQSGTASLIINENEVKGGGETIIDVVSLGSGKLEIMENLIKVGFMLFQLI